MERRDRRGNRQGERYEVKMEPGDAVVDEAVALDVSVEELSEFLEADLVEVDANPEFKERLRQKLWELVAARYRH